MIRIFPLTLEDRDKALADARRVVEYYAERRKRAGKRLGFDREYQTRLWFVGFCAENAIARILKGQVGNGGEEYGTEWDIDVPELGHIQVKTTQTYGLNPFPVKEPRNEFPDPNGLVWLTYYRDSDVQQIHEMTWNEVFKFPKEGQFFQVPIPREFWANVER